MFYYIDEMLRVMIWLLPIYCAGRVFVNWMRRDEMPVQYSREVILAVFSLFMAGLLTLTFENGMEWMKSSSLSEAIARFQAGIGVNKVPFHTIRNYIKYETSRRSLWTNLAGNVVMFIPWGLCLPLLWEKFHDVPKMIVMCLALPVAIEFCQLFIGRSVDVDDIILNFIGGIIGAALYVSVKKLFPGIGRFAKTQLN